MYMNKVKKWYRQLDPPPNKAKQKTREINDGVLPKFKKEIKVKSTKSKYT